MWFRPVHRSSAPERQRLAVELACTSRATRRPAVPPLTVAVWAITVCAVLLSRIASPARMIPTPLWFHGDGCGLDHSCTALVHGNLIGIDPVGASLLNFNLLRVHLGEHCSGSPGRSSASTICLIRWLRGIFILHSEFPERSRGGFQPGSFSDFLPAISTSISGQRMLIVKGQKKPPPPDSPRGDAFWTGRILAVM